VSAPPHAGATRETRGLVHHSSVGWGDTRDRACVRAGGGRTLPIVLMARLPGDERAVLLIEQLARIALSIAHRGYLLEAGGVVLSGTAVDLRADQRVQEIYMGVNR
jgi:ABC-type uncharacterized transport system ATPase subunit